jgi:hypothetical protein
MEIEADRSALSAVELRTIGTVVFVGHARLPQSLAPRDSSPVVSVELEADSVSGEIVSVGARAIPDLGAKLLTTVLVGHNINDSPVAVAEGSAAATSAPRRRRCPPPC